MWGLLEQYVLDASGYVALIFTLLEKLDSTMMASVAMVLWTVWWRRNQKCWNNNFPPTFEVIRRAKDTLMDWLQVRCKPVRDRLRTDPTREKWTKPQQGTVKCNVDAACYVTENQYSIGACLRDADGNFMRASTSHFEGQPDIKEAEAHGLLITLKWLQQLHIERVEIEMDCMEVVNSVVSKDRNVTEYGTAIEQCQCLLNLFPNCKVSYIRRQANRVAHELARVARFYASPHIYDYCPPCIEHIIINEMH
jgi:ribonuclease HI